MVRPDRYHGVAVALSAPLHVYFHTFGCKANQYDTEVVRQAFESAGGTAVEDPHRADIAVVNSCTVTHTGEAKMRSLVRRLQRENPRVRTVVMGCAAALDDGTIAGLPGVVGVVGGADPEVVLGAVGVTPPPPDPFLRAFPRGARAWLKIQDGCDEHCTFCATTLARGANRSRAPADIVAEARLLAGAHEEIVLTGVHIGTYGADRDDDASLSRLVERLVTEVDRVRFRLSSVEATEIDDRLVDLLATAPRRIAPHLHAPLQSGSDRVLKRMGRHWYTAGEYRRRCEVLAERLPVLGLGADVIVGFPGETARDHEETRALIEALPFTYLHVFPYSERPDAAASRLGDDVSPAAKADRSAALRAIAADKGERHRTRRAGGRADVAVLSHREGRAQGLTGDYLDVYLSAARADARQDGVLRAAEDGTLWLDPE